MSTTEQKEYNHKELEQKWQKFWDNNKTFKTSEPGKKKFYCLDMFPYPSGAGLHVGHPLGYTASDTVSRFKRMNGFSVLHPMGFDAFGLPAEQHAVATGEHPAKITHENCEKFTTQLKRVGLSYDWDRSIKTCDADYYKWTQWIFLQIFNSWFDEKEQKAKHIDELPIPAEVKSAGAKAICDYQAQYRLAFYTDAMVNWCPALGTVLANEEVIDGKSERGGHDVIKKPMKQWMLRITKYTERLLSELNEINWPENIKEQQRNWIGKKIGAEIKFKIKDTNETLTAFTTRPDTLFGVTFFVISPEHPLAQTVVIDENREKVQAYCAEANKMNDFMRTIENRKKTGVFTGRYVINPISGELAPLYIGDYVLMTVGTGAVMGVPAHDEGGFEFARTFQLDIKPVLIPNNAEAEVAEAVREGEVAWTEPGIMIDFPSAVHKELSLTGKDNKQAGQIITDWLAKNNLGRRVVNYKLRDWLFSRQRYWGEPIPIVHWEDGTMSALNESDLPLVLPEVKDYKPSDGGESPLAKAEDWLIVNDKNGRKGRRETNTMPQWAGSCWYYLRFIDPQNSEKGWDAKLEKDWMSVDLYIGGAEHAVLHLLYARFWHKILYDLGHVTTKEPFHKLFNQGMVQAYAFKNKRGALVPSDEVGGQDSATPKHIKTGEPLERIVAKMSKSLRNVITLDEIVDEYGADTFRMYLMFMGPLDSSRSWDPKAISGNYRSIKRAWVFVTENKESGIKATVKSEDESKDAKKAINRLVKKVSEDIEAMSFNTAISAMMEFLNQVSSLPVSKETLDKFVLVLSPFAPHVAEELWQKLGYNQSAAFEKWPVVDEKYLTDDLANVVVQVNGKKRGLFEVDVNISEDSLKTFITEQMSKTDYKIESGDKFIVVFKPGTKIPKLVNVIKG